jgi:hypothetical protein
MWWNNTAQAHGRCARDNYISKCNENNRDGDDCEVPSNNFDGLSHGINSTGDASSMICSRWCVVFSNTCTVPDLKAVTLPLWPFSQPCSSSPPASEPSVQMCLQRCLACSQRHRWLSFGSIIISTLLVTRRQHAPLPQKLQRRPMGWERKPLLSTVTEIWQAFDYESLNANLRLVLLTRVSKWNSDP